MRFLQFADLLETTGADNRVDAIESYVVQSIRYLCMWERSPHFRSKKRIREFESDFNLVKNTPRARCFNLRVNAGN